MLTVRARAELHVDCLGLAMKNTGSQPTSSGTGRRIGSVLVLIVLMELITWKAGWSRQSGESARVAGSQCTPLSHGALSGQRPAAEQRQRHGAHSVELET